MDNNIFLFDIEVPSMVISCFRIDVVSIEDMFFDNFNISKH
jgi:hypothetical protein